MQINALNLFAYPDLLVIYWRRGEKLRSDINIKLDGHALPRPLLGIEFAEGDEYLIAGFSPDIHVRKQGVVAIESQDQPATLELAFEEYLPELPFALLESFSLATRVRIEKGLLIQASRHFPSMTPRAVCALAASLAETNVLSISGPDGTLYIRLPWLPNDSPALLDAQLIRLHEEKSITESVAVKALVFDGFVHMVVGEAHAEGLGEAVCILSAGNLRHLPFRLNTIEHCQSGGGMTGWVDSVLERASTDDRVLKGYITSSISAPTDLHAEQNRSQPIKVQGRLVGVRDGKLTGWVVNQQRPRRATPLRILVDGVFREEVLADRPVRVGKGNQTGKHVFFWSIPQELFSGRAHQVSVVCGSTGIELHGSPLQFGFGEFDAEMRIDENGVLAGWVQERVDKPQPVQVQVFIDEVFFETVINPVVTRGRKRGGVGDRAGPLRFEARLPDDVFDTSEHLLRLYVTDSQGSGRRSIGPPLKVIADYRGYLDTVTPAQVAGWVINTVAPKRQTQLEIVHNGRVVAHGVTGVPRPDVRGQATDLIGFDIPIRQDIKAKGSVRLEVRLAGDRRKLFSSTSFYIPHDLAIQTLAAVSAFVNDPRCLEQLPGHGGIDHACLVWLRQQILSPIQARLREDRTGIGQITLPLQQVLRVPDRVERDSKVDVIIPVYGGGDIVLRCLTSVLCAQNQQEMALVVIDDGSPDPVLSGNLENLAKVHGFTLLKNPANLGFVASVNRGMRLNVARDVILLNSDTVVADGWLDRLRGAAYSADNIGTVTPMSNNATICSFPRFCAVNRLYGGKTAGDMAEVFALANNGMTVDIPTAVGFCMYIKRSVIEDVGYFDKGQWGKGYAEENDFSLKAASQGWRSVAACDVFVEHEGGVSFGASALPQLKKNLEVLNALYPDYARTVQRFIDADPLSVARSNVARVLIREFSSRYMLHVVHGLGGGTKKAVEDIGVCLSKEGEHVLELSSISLDQWVLRCTALPYVVHYQSSSINDLVDDLVGFGVWHIHYHQTMHYPVAIWELPGRLGVAYDFTIHDYLSVCPRINMMDESGGYCGDSQMSSDNCSRCVTVNGLDHDLMGIYEDFGGAVSVWRQKYLEVLKGARLVIAPSRSAAEIVSRHFDLENLVIQPHPEPEYEYHPHSERVIGYSICVIGAIGDHKGYQRLLQCVRSAEKEGLPLRFHVIGYTTDDASLLKYRTVSISGEYVPAELARHVEATGARIALFLSPWPETFCYALSEAWQAGLFPVALDIGAIAERIKDCGCGKLLSVESDAKTINRELMALLEGDEGLSEMSVKLGGGQSNILENYYHLPSSSENQRHESS